MIKNKLALLALPLITTLSLQANNQFNDPFFNDPFGDNMFKEMLQMQKEMDKMFERMQQRRLQRSSGIVNPLGTYRMAVQSQFMDKGDKYELVTNIPESKENHIDIKTKNGMMSITAKIIREEEKKTAGMFSRSSSVRMYQQAIPMPNDADDASIQTAYENGKLVIRIAKRKGVAKANTLKINGKTQQIQTSSAPTVPQKAQAAENLPEKKRVEITKEFDQTPLKSKKTTEKTAEESKSKESPSKIKKEIIHTDKTSMI